jgi:hypothetical protein
MLTDGILWIVMVHDPPKSDKNFAMVTKFKLWSIAEGGNLSNS